HSCACRPCSVSHVTFPSFLSYCSGAHRHLHSFPTRRSSDLRDLARLVGFARGTLALTPHLPSDSLWRGPLRQLHEYLIAAVEETGLLAGKSRLVLVPHAELHYLPFAALIERNGEGRFLIERYELAVTPSASVWLALGDRP